ncbi:MULTISPECIES: enterobactin transporter EntS [unclassified Rhodococcus (in: high G+C Gram-positive bacteria)]|uniref:enterobactin transporter EntS n=1 Tax=unclassified Rhodococcus (in: high G+C Gram-positive bacteria) TaxID=192944 RepID=UPI00146D643C|nr:enterobactin transporter EntS [Rhodococcus sp. (in: high G+C Gram-positive bacteria)]MBF0663514.1 enterobactin transporter EntS [Rhodococcus sp. (in: high G+C Gram-positive bacteria)]NME78977.1 enterobactin transporter EntS [Rhodococcus sp. 105337]
MAFLEKLTIDLDPIRTSREFRYLFTARVVSLLGLGFLIVAVPVQVYQLTGSTAQVAAVTAVLGITTFAATFVGGVLADRFDRRNVIAIARGTAAVAFALLAVNAYLPEPQMWAIYLISVVDGAAGGISATALMAVTPSLVPRDKLAAAGALMALTADLGSMVGPALGGVVIAAGGVGLAYALAAFTTVITTFCITRLPPLPPATVSVESPLRSIAAGFTYAFRNRVIGQVLVVGFAAMLLTGWAVLLPAFADRVLGAGPSVVGLLYAAPAVGAVLGSLTSGWTGSVRRSGLVVFVLMAVSAAGLAGAGATGVTAVVLLGLAAYGFGDSLADVMRYATVQRNTADEYRGRIAAVWSAQVTAGTSLGAIAAGVIASVVPMSVALTVYGVAGIVLVVVMWASFPTLRRFVDDDRLEPVS